MKRRLSLQERREIRKKGWYKNESETAAAKIFQRRGITVVRRGYPDFTVVRAGEIIGFIEVKPHHGKDLHKDQETFARFCVARGIPFMRWTPEDGERAIAVGKSTGASALTTLQGLNTGSLVFGAVGMANQVHSFGER